MRMQHGKMVYFILVLALLLCSCSLEGNSVDTIALVQGGYLGEYTDITVKEILDNYYGVLYETSVWDGWKTDNGSEIIQVQYYDESAKENGVTVQFKMLDEQCFKVSAFVDPMETIDESTDLMAVVNNLYLLSYVSVHRDEMSDNNKANAFIGELDTISGSAALYGASADYQGNRAQICKKEGGVALSLSVPWLLDQYGLIDISAYELPGETNTAPQPEPPTVTVQVPCTGLTVTDSEITFVALDSVWQLSFTVEPIDTTDLIIFHSSNNAVATVDACGRVTAVGNGEATITITCGNVVRECVVMCNFGGTVDTSAPTLPSKESGEENEESSTNTGNTEPAVNALKAVMCGRQAFLNNATERYTYIDEIRTLAWSEFEYSLIATQFSVVDMDQDGTTEVIVELTNNVDGWLLVLRYQDGNVYGYGFNFRGMLDLRIDGTAMGSSGASDSEYYRLMFRDFDVYETSVSDDEVLAEAAAWYDFNDWNIEEYVKN